MVLPKLPKLERGVRFPLPAPIFRVARIRVALIRAALSWAALTLPFFVTLSAAEAATLVTPEGARALPEWTPEQRAGNIARVEVYRNEALSGFFLRLAGRESPHVHEASDLLVHLLEGEGRIHFVGGRVVPVAAGDVILIPRGEAHWAENTGEEAMVVFAAFVPPGK